jgi:hypothetical protein
MVVVLALSSPAFAEPAECDILQTGLEVCQKSNTSTSGNQNQKSTLSFPDGGQIKLHTHIKPPK